MMNKTNNLSFLIILPILLLHFILNIYSPSLYYTIKPYFYLVFLIFILKTSGSSFLNLFRSRKNIFFGLFLSFSFLIIYYILGLFVGFLESPFNHHLSKLIENIFRELLPVVGLESLRFLLLKKTKKNKVQSFLVFIFIFLLDFNFSNFISNFTFRRQAFETFCSYFLPVFTKHLVYTYLYLKDAPSIPFLFQIIEKFSLLILPIVPDFDWFMMGTFSLIKTVLIYILFKEKILKDESSFSNKRMTSSLLSYAFVLLFATFLTCFMLGFFSYEPIVILSNSMTPTFCRGDVLIIKTKNVNFQTLSVGEVIVYQSTDKYIAHRIINKDDKTYQTKGDANALPDIKEVELKQIKGVYKFHIPLLGYPAIWFHDYLLKE